MPVPDLTLRLEKGSELTFSEGDGDFTKLRDAIDALEETTLLAINQDGTLKNARVGYAVDTGSTDDYAVTVTGNYSDITALAGVIILVKANTSNIGASTVAVNGFAATDIRKDHGQILDNADIVDGKVMMLVYNGSNFQLLNPRSSSQSNYGTDVGIADAYKISFSDADALGASRFQMPETLYAGYRVAFKALNDNTGASTLEIKIDSPSTSLTGSIRKSGTSALTAKDIKAGQVYEVIWDGSFWQLVVLPQSAIYRSPTFVFTATANGTPLGATNHNLGGVPDVVQVIFVRNATTPPNDGYAEDDELPMESINSGDQSRPIITVRCTDTQVTVFNCAITSDNIHYPNADGSSGDVTMAPGTFDNGWSVRVVLTRFI